MILLYIVCGFIVLIGSWSLWQWWRDEQEKAGKVTRLSMPLVAFGPPIPAITSPATPLHPTIDPYLSELRAYLLTPPLPQGPGEMAERVYAHLTQWVNTHLNEDANHTVDVSFEGELLVAPETESRFINMSTNEPVPTGYLEELMREE
jgi:hypothetical protein